MKPALVVAAFAAAVAANVTGEPLVRLAAAPVHEEHAQHAPATLTLDHGKKWTTDAPLREGMSAIRAALAAQQARIHRGALDAAESRALGEKIEAQVGGIVANCKLPPEADANLHIVVADLVAAADALQGKSQVKPARGARDAIAATNRYGRYFQHPGWTELR